MKVKIVLTRHEKGKDLLYSLYYNGCFICSMYSLEVVLMRLKETLLKYEHV